MQRIARDFRWSVEVNSETRYMYRCVRSVEWENKDIALGTLGMERFENVIIEFVRKELEKGDYPEKFVNRVRRYWSRVMWDQVALRVWFDCWRDGCAWLDEQEEGWEQEYLEDGDPFLETVENAFKGERV